MKSSRQEIYQLLRTLFPICRSLTGAGVRQTLEIIRELVPIDFHEEPSGSQVFDWIVPLEWSIESAWIENIKGEKIVDFAENNLHIMSYSQSVDRVLSREELDKHLYSLEDIPDAIPYTTSYYRDDWKFCLKHSDRQKMQDSQYRAVINSKHFTGSLTWGEIFVKGELEEEILFSCNICHPSLASNELSGPVLATFLARYVMNLKPRYSYRFVFVPETLGCLVFLKHRLQHLQEFCRAGFVLTCLGDGKEWSVVQTPSTNSLADMAATVVLRDRAPLKLYPWLNRGSDERQYNWPTVNIPTVCLSRSKFGEYKEYHTSLDNLDFVTEQSIGDSYDMLVDLVDLLDANHVYRVTTVGEPFLSNRGLYPSHSTRFSGHSMKPMMNFLNACDGTRTLVEAIFHSQAPAGVIMGYLPSLLAKDVIRKVA